MTKQVLKNDSPEIRRLKWLLANNKSTVIGIVAGYKRLATELGAQLIPPKTWSWNYIHSVVNSKNMKPSKRLAKAITKLYKLKQGISSKTMSRVTILIRNGDIPKNTIVHGHLKVCQRENCKTFYIPASPSQKYCSTECKKLAQVQRVRSPTKVKSKKDSKKSINKAKQKIII